MKNIAHLGILFSSCLLRTEIRPFCWTKTQPLLHSQELASYSWLVALLFANCFPGLGTGSGLLVWATPWFIISAGRVLGKATANTHCSCCHPHLPLLLNQGRSGGSQSSTWSNPAPFFFFQGMLPFFFFFTQSVDLMADVGNPCALVEPNCRRYQAAWPIM